MDCIVHGILQARILEWVAFPFSGDLPWDQGSHPSLLPHRQILYELSQNFHVTLLVKANCKQRSESREFLWSECLSPPPQPSKIHVLTLNHRGGALVMKMKPLWMGLLVFSHYVQLFWDPTDCSLPGSPLQGIFQARILQWVAISSSKGSAPPRYLALNLPHWQVNSLPLSHLRSPWMGLVSCKSVSKEIPSPSTVRGHREKIWVLWTRKRPLPSCVGTVTVVVQPPEVWETHLSCW